MRIGIDARLWNETGVGRYIRNLVTGLQKLDKKNEYVLFVKGKEYDRIKNQELKIEHKKWKVVKADVQWHSLKEQLLFSRILNKENLDLVHFPYFSTPISYKKPFVVTIHDLIISKFPTGKASTLPTPLYYLKHAAYEKVLSHTVSHAKHIITPSNHVKNDVMKAFTIPEENITVTYEGVDDALSTVPKESTFSYLQDIPYFIYIGNAYPHKNVELLIDAFSDFLHSFPEFANTHLLLVGKEDYFYKRLKKNKKNTEGNVLFLHDVSDKDLSYLLHHAQALVAPSKDEGFGLTTVEAMSASCLVLASNIAVFKEVCGKWALYFDVREKNDLVDKMKLVLKMDEKEKNVYKREAKKYIKKYSWERMVKQTLDVYESSNSL